MCRQSTAESTSTGEISSPCPLHAGLEQSPSLPHIGIGSSQQSQPLAMVNGGCRSGLNGSRPTPTPSRQQSHHQPGRWTGETPTPTATPTPTPTPAPLLMSQHPAPPWFQAYLPREVALELLMHEEVRWFCHSLLSVSVKPYFQPMHNLKDCYLYVATDINLIRFKRHYKA
ncbi:unnamed protein product [Hydatigera taeniaeformis]|uniref:Uncharacterized protein n=1 Tax=Hydatigena taeniaeformis TaxID=6205 RepID=A0A0R3WWB4_HYDTA|nr:unnamed protein product [Hydatigera taeniaeformis]